jgi:hypothetical protein
LGLAGVRQIGILTLLFKDISRAETRFEPLSEAELSAGACHNRGAFDLLRAGMKRSDFGI